MIKPVLLQVTIPNYPRNDDDDNCLPEPSRQETLPLLFAKSAISYDENDGSRERVKSFGKHIG